MPFPPTSPLASRLFLLWLPLLGLSAVIVHHYWFVYSHAINIPYQDDIYDFLQFVNLVEAAPDSWDAIVEWFRQYNDHRTNASRLLVYGAYLVQGEVDFRTLTLLANLVLPAILVLFYVVVRDEEFRWLFLLVSALLLLNLRSHTIVLWSQPAFAYYFVFFYAFACFHVLHKVNVSKFVLAAVLCTLASFTYASGQVVWLLGLVSLLHQSLVTRTRSLLYPAIWLLIAFAMLAMWRLGFVALATDGNLFGGFPIAVFPDQLIDPPAPLHQALARYAAWLLVILGCAFNDSSTLVAGAVGIAALALLSFISVRFYKYADIRLELCCWFVVASAAAISFGRALALGPSYILHERYSFLSVMLVCTLVLLVQVRFRFFRSCAIYAVVLLAGMYSVWAFRHFESPLQDNLSKRYSEFNKGRFWVVSQPLDESGAIVNNAIAAGIYNPPCKPFPQCEIVPANVPH